MRKFFAALAAILLFTAGCVGTLKPMRGLDVEYDSEPPVTGAAVEIDLPKAFCPLAPKVKADKIPYVAGFCAVYGAPLDGESDEPAE